MRIFSAALCSAWCLLFLPLQAKAINFNPAISLSLMGHAYYDNRNNQSQAWLDQAALFPMQGEGEYSDKSFNLDGSELSFSSNVDGYFKAFMAISYEDEGVHLEEAWLQSSQLPFGLQVRAGRFLSAVGYHNTKHKHEWDFMDQNLAYQSIFHGEHLHGDGLQLTWLLPTDSYWLVGTEVLQGDHLNGFGQELEDIDTLNASALKDRRGPNFYSSFIRFSPDLGSRHALQIGASSAWHRQQQNLFEQSSNNILADGKAHLLGLQAVYKWFARDTYGTGSIDLSAEYFYASSQLRVRDTSLAPLTSENIRQQLHTAYIQALYGFAPRWQAGLRYSAAGFAGSHSNIDNKKTSVNTASQTSALLVWRLTEFSRLRFEATYLDKLHTDQQRQRSAAQFMLGYVVFLGTHPAHAF